MLAGCGYARRLLEHRSPAFPVRSATHKSHPDPGGGEFDKSEVVGVMLLEAGRDRSGVLEEPQQPRSIRTPQRRDLSTLAPLVRFDEQDVETELRSNQ